MENLGIVGKRRSRTFIERGLMPNFRLKIVRDAWGLAPFNMTSTFVFHADIRNLIGLYNRTEHEIEFVYHMPHITSYNITEFYITDNLTVKKWVTYRYLSISIVE